MPRLHKYKAINSYYVKTSINNSIITFHITPEGYRKLSSSGISAGDRFGQAFLVDLYRSGDAFTNGSGAGKAEGADKRQLIFDFPDAPVPDSIDTSCAVTNDLEEVKETDPPEGISRQEINRGLLNRIPVFVKRAVAVGILLLILVLYMRM